MPQPGGGIQKYTTYIRSTKYNIYKLARRSNTPSADDRMHRVHSSRSGDEKAKQAGKQRREEERAEGEGKFWSPIDGWMKM